MALGADPTEFEDVSQFSVPELLGNGVGPVFEFGCIDFNDCSTDSTGQVVMVRVNDTSSIEALSAIGHHNVHVA